MEPHMWELVDLVLQNSAGKSLKVADVFTKKENTLAGTYQHILTLKPLREVKLHSSSYCFCGNLNFNFEFFGNYPHRVM